MAITRAQQYRQMLEDGGMLVQPSMTGKRPGYRGDAAARSSGAADSGRVGGSDVGESSTSSDSRDDGPDDRGSPIQNQVQSMVRSGFTPKEIRRFTNPSVIDKVRGSRFNNPITRGILRTGLYALNPSIGALDFRKAMQLKNLYDYTTDQINNPVSEEDLTLGLITDQQKQIIDKQGNIGKLTGAFDPDQTFEAAKKFDDEGGFFRDAEPMTREEFNAYISEKGYADGGRIGAAEGGIMPRLNQLSGSVSSAEQMLQQINERLQTAESSLGSGGSMQQLEQADPNNLIPGTTVPTGGTFMGRPLNAMSRRENPLGPINQLNVTPPQTPVAMQQPLSGIPAASYADGGRIGAAEGGIMDLETGRQMYFLGKLVKKATKAVKKVVKSPIGKAALIGAIGFGIPGVSSGFFSKGLAGTKFGLGAKNFLANTILGTPVGDFGTTRTGGILEKALGFVKDKPFQAITAASTVAGLLTPQQEEEAQQIADNTGIDIEEARNQILKAAAGQDDFRARAFKADGGIMRLGYQEGSKEPVAKKTMPLLDMGGKEMDLREDGGFVPIGRMEKADDVPARLSKNEFVFTADAVRNAGDGNVDKGAEVMYNMMKNLESGGDVSEESQGLEGARRMFQTSQRLEEVL
jgi:hypothetical protein